MSFGLENAKYCNFQIIYFSKNVLRELVITCSLGTGSLYGNLGLGCTLEVDLLLSIVCSLRYLFTMLDCSRACKISDRKIYMFVIFYLLFAIFWSVVFQLIKIPVGLITPPVELLSSFLE